MSLFDDIGGEAALRPLIDDFIDRCFDDVMIGFIFQRADRARIKRFEYEHAAHLLGAGTPYTGRDLAAVHRKHRILSGQFGRRRQILIEVCDDRGVPMRVRDSWIAAQEALRDQITPETSSTCNDGVRS
ncbi:MAG: hypothetical protein KC543_11370 [Myxococcales bacterium]|nr:hypothetical protein [Myxococcales bacterium]